MPTCENMVRFWAHIGGAYRPLERRCGLIGDAGRVLLCPECRKAAERTYPQGWRHFPGDTCIHGIYHDPAGRDCACPHCEQ